MSTASKNSKKSGNISNRKKDHLDICVNKDKYNVESSITSGFENIHFIHEAMPELNEENINTKITFLDHEIKLPLFISCFPPSDEYAFCHSEGGFRIKIETTRIKGETSSPPNPQPTYDATKSRYESIDVLRIHPGIFTPKDPL